MTFFHILNAVNNLPHVSKLIFVQRYPSTSSNLNKINNGIFLYVVISISALLKQDNALFKERIMDQKRTEEFKGTQY